MKFDKFTYTFLPFSILLITVSSVNAWTTLPIGNTFVWWTVYAFIIFLLLRARKYLGNKLIKDDWPVRLFLFLVLCSFIHGALVAEYYWDWKLLVSNLMVFLLPLASYVFCSHILLRETLKIWIKYAFVAFPLFLLVIDSEAYGRYLLPVSFLLLFFPKLPKKWKFISIGVIIFIVIASVEARSNVIKFLIPFCLSFIFFFRKQITINLFTTVNTIILLTPFLLFYLAATDVFNIFNMSEYLSNWSDMAEVNKGGGESASLLADTRTFIYAEEILSAIKNDYWLFGRSMARGYDSDFFDWLPAYQDYLKDTNRSDRQSSEVSILNIFNYFGIVGVLSYFLIFVSASYTAIRKSKNIYLKIVGVYIGFRWTYAWVEDFSRFDLNYLFLWILVGICFSVPFRNMSNRNFELWLKSIFYSKQI